MFEIKKTDQIVPVTVKPPETAVPAGLPSDVMPSYPVVKLDPKKGPGEFVTPTPSILPSEHASLPPVNSLGDGSVKITLPEWIGDSDSAKEQSKGSAERGPADFARAAKRQIDRLERAA